MKQFNKKILTASILLVLGSVSSAWADDALLAVDASNNSDYSTKTKDSYNTAYVDKSDNSFVDKSDNSYTDKSDNSYTDKSVYVEKTDNSYTDKSDNSYTDKSDNSYTDKSVYIEKTDKSKTFADADDGAQAAVAGKDAYNTKTEVEAEDDGLAVNTGTYANVTRIDLNADDGAVAVYAGKDVKVNQSQLEGEVSGVGAGDSTALALLGTLTGGNFVADSFNGSAGILQNQQNYAAGALLQQQVSFQGNVNVDTK